MEHNYLKTSIGKIHAAVVLPTIILAFLLFCYDYSKGKSPVIWGLLISVVGLVLFLRAKFSVIKTGKVVSFGCDLMDQKNAYFYFAGWVMIIGGYFLSFK